MTVSDLVNELGKLSSQNKQLYKTYKEQKENEDSLRAELVAKLEETGLKSAKTNDFMASIAQRTDIRVTHEQSVLDWLKEAPDIETDQYIGLKTTNFKVLAKEVRKQTGEIIPGTEVVLSESLSIKGVK